jgi:hypothetical protein
MKPVERKRGYKDSEDTNKGKGKVSFIIYKLGRTEPPLYPKK